MILMLRRWQIAVLIFGFATHVRGAAVIDTNRVSEIAAMLPEKPLGIGRPISDRAAWEKLAAIPAFTRQIAHAERMALVGDPALTDDLYLDYTRTGNRDHGQKVMFERADRLVAFTVAECLENKGRFLPALTNTIISFCDEKSWTYPAHDHSLDVFYGRVMQMDLRATALAWEMATIDYLLGDKLPANVRQLLRDNVRRRVLTPFRDMIEGRRHEINWLRIKNNWNAVCLAGVLGAALEMEDSPMERARYIAEVEYYIPNFLKGFPKDGYCGEGLGYWNYGFGHYIMMAETLRENTGGKLDLMINPAAWLPAQFATRDEILDGIYPSISDCAPGTKPDPKFVHYVDQRFGFGDSFNATNAFWLPQRSLVETALFAFLPERLPAIAHDVHLDESPLRSWFPDGGLLIARNASLTTGDFGVTLKGGNNGESHNHNDVGSFSVVLGKKMVICDPGGEVYTARTFGPHRYDSKVINSFGHAVPIIGGQLQHEGAAAHAEILHHSFSDTEDSLSMDIRSAYPLPELQKLVRNFVFRRDRPSLTVRDEMACTSPQLFETALITWGNWKQISSNELTITDGGSIVRVKIDTGGKAFTLRAEKINEDVHTYAQPVHLGIVLKSPAKKAEVSLTITPEAQIR